jgi:5-methylcytosine-specific restriction endonuclease McrA
MVGAFTTAHRAAIGSVREAADAAKRRGMKELLSPRPDPIGPRIVGAPPRKDVAVRTGKPESLRDRDLLDLLHHLVAAERDATAELIACIAEVDRRRLFAPAGFASMIQYCVGKLGLSHDAAYRRIQAARVVQRCERVLPALRDGRLHLTGVLLLDPYLTPENAAELLSAAYGKTKPEIEELLARRFPRTEELPMVMALPSGRGVADHELAPARVGERNGTPAAAAMPARLAPVAPERYALHLSFGKGTRDKLDYARALLGHRIPSGDLEEVLDRVLDLAIAQLEKGKFAATDRPRRPRPSSTDPRSIPAAVQRAVWERDGGRCTFVAGDGHRCAERTQLEYDHLVPVARGGQATVANLALRCRVHNRLAAERTFGAGFMERKREAARRAAPAGAPRSAEQRLDAQQQAEARAVAAEQAEDVFAGLRTLGCRAEQARRAVEHCMALPACSLEQRMRAALAFIRPRVRVQGGATAPG